MATMKILMLGWEFPPHIAGGLGVACQGLTEALNARGVSITFCLPRPVRTGPDPQLEIIGLPEAAAMRPPPPATAAPAQTTTVPIASDLPGAYAGPHHPEGIAATGPTAIGQRGLISFLDGGPGQPAPTYRMDQGPDTAAQRYAEGCIDRLRGRRHDLIHAHDWPTFPAAIALSAISRTPWIAHIHATEYDRNGERIDLRIYDIERRGMHAADRVITVSAFTKAVCVERYGVDAGKIEVLYNGAALPAGPHRPAAHRTARPADRRQKVVLFLGRITSQKGPNDFVAAARRVLDHLSDVRFVMAGAGDLGPAVVEAAAAAGIGQHFSFTGFLRDDQVHRAYDMADVYVMPSASEPFGIAPLEAIAHDVPVIISRQSGVSEVLRHALKVDPWNTDDLADKIIAVLRHSPLGDTLRANARVEIQDLTWEAAADRCLRVYAHTLEAARTRP